ncbi:deoxyribonuclease-2-alpha-like [Polymixia lowei]
MWQLLFGIGLLVCGCDSKIDVKCKNEEGTPVDWYILYKLPALSSSDGLDYLYMDENTNGWKPGSKRINSNSGILANTLEPYFEYNIRKTEGIGYMLYNDQPPEPHKTASSSFGHSKGVVMLDKDTGVWLSHKKSKNDFWPSSGNPNGQTFICVTYPYKEFKNIGEQLKYIHVYSFDYKIPDSFYNQLKCVAQRDCYPKNKPWFRWQEMVSLKGNHFTSSAKYTRFDSDLYSGLLVDHFGQELYVKSWGRMRQPLPSNCTTAHYVYNVKSVKPPQIQAFLDTVDHSKWCVTAKVGWTCIADMNRELSQMGRGGGAICTENVAVWNAFIAIAYEYEPCSTKPPHQDSAQFRPKL